MKYPSEIALGHQAKHILKTYCQNHPEKWNVLAIHQYFRKQPWKKKRVGCLSDERLYF